jgi:hypothetical protein
MCDSGMWQLMSGDGEADAAVLASERVSAALQVGSR